MKNEIVKSLSDGVELKSDGVFEDELTSNDKDKIIKNSIELFEILSKKDSDKIKEILDEMVNEEIEILENSSALLASKFSNLKTIENDKTNSISSDILSLNEKLKELNPHNFNFEKSKILSFLPFIKKPIDRYLTKFKSLKEIIDEIILNLENASKLLREDNLVLDSDKDYYKKVAISLQRKSMVFKAIIDACEKHLSNLDEDERKFYENSLLLNLNKKLRSIYEILAVTRQGILSNSIIIDTNKELIGNISNIKVVTKRALEIGISMAISLENQKSVLKATNETRNFANELIAKNAEKINDQVAEINKMSSEGTLDIENLKAAFSKIDEAMAKMDEFKTESLIKLKSEIVQFENLTKNLEDKVKEREKIEKLKNGF